MQHLQSISFTGSQLSLMVSSVMLLCMSLHTPTVFLSLRLSPFVVTICAPPAGCELLESSRPGESDSKSSFHYSLMLTALLLCKDKGPLVFEIHRLLCNFHIYTLLSTVTSLSNANERNVQYLSCLGRHIEFHSCTHTGHSHLSRLPCYLVCA